LNGAHCLLDEILVAQASFSNINTEENKNPLCWDAQDHFACIVACI
jgi:hypothetical protein